MAAPGLLIGLNVLTDGTNAATAIIYDNASAASGKVLAKVVVPGASLTGGLELPRGVEAINGLYVSLAGTGAACNVYYI